MTRERAKELLPIIQAYADGQDVQVYEGDYWHDCDETRLAWAIHKHKELRIKPEPKYRPFKNCDELIATWQKMVGYPAKPNTMPLIWVKDKASKSTACITCFDDNRVLIVYTWVSFEELFTNWNFLDGSPFGVEE